MPFNGLTVALNTQTDKLLANPATEALVRDMMMEVVGAARALGVNNVDEAFVEKMIAMTKVMTPYSPSMKLDYDFHRPMEIHYIYSRPIQIAADAGFRMPKLQMLEQQLVFLENKWLVFDETDNDNIGFFATHCIRQLWKGLKKIGVLGRVTYFLLKSWNFLTKINF